MGARAHATEPRSPSRRVGRRPRGNCAKQTQFPAGRQAPTIPIIHCSTIPARCRSCETNPIPGYAGGRGLRDVGRVTRGNRAKRSQTWAGRGIWGTVRQGGVNRAKQSQFPAGPAGTGPGGRGTKMQNEANFWAPAGGIPSIPLFHYSTIPIRCRLCKTKPIGHGSRCPATLVRALFPGPQNESPARKTLDAAWPIWYRGLWPC